MSKFSERIKSVRESLGMNKTQFAALLETNVPNITRYENEDMGVALDSVEAIADKLKVNPAWLLGWSDDKYGEGKHKVIFYPDFIDVPILARVPAGMPTLVDEDIIDRIQIPKSYTNNGEQVFGILIKGDSMTDIDINDGDTVLVRLQPTAENGQTVIAKVNGEEVTCKRFYRTNSKVTLEPANGKYRPLNPDQVEIIGIVFKVIKDMY